MNYQAPASMNSYAIALGSNLGDRVANLSQALGRLKELGRVVKQAPLLENPPWLPAKAPTDWYSFFLNTAVVLESPLKPLELLDATQKIEAALGRPANHPNWSPRSIDIDLLFDLSGSEFKHPRLSLPHPSWKKRNFVLAPLVHILTGHATKNTPTVLKLYRKQKLPLPALMGIINVTPDSFSQHKRETIEYGAVFAEIKNHFAQGTAFIDIGAESTRPGATALSATEEWQRLEPVLNLVRELKQQNSFTQISLDTYHPQTAARALDYKVDVLNDVGGLKLPAMRELASTYSGIIVMHSLSVPADKNIHWPEDTNSIEAMDRWLNETLEGLVFLKPEQIIWDPGFGFGKTPRQSLDLIKSFYHFKKTPVRSLVGHSRKSFMNLWSQKPFAQRDSDTLAVSHCV